MKFKNFVITFALILFLFQFFKLPYSAYNLLKWDYTNRMTQSYGYCDNESWGFYNYVIEKFELKNKSINIINYEGHVKLDVLFNLNKSIENKSNYYLILNYQSINDETIFDNFEYLKDYKILYRYNNCYLLSDA